MHEDLCGSRAGRSNRACGSLKCPLNLHGPRNIAVLPQRKSEGAGVALLTKFRELLSTRMQSLVTFFAKFVLRN